MSEVPPASWLTPHRGVLHGPAGQTNHTLSRARCSRTGCTPQIKYKKDSLGSGGRGERVEGTRDE
eukprot:scaffold162302_cov32-Tisochrysis_lutea.AAC.5